MKIKRQIKERFRQIPLPSADKILPKEALVEKRPKSYKKLTLRLAVAVLCIGAIITSLLFVLNKNSNPSPVYNYSLGHNNYGNNASNNNASYKDNTYGGVSDAISKPIMGSPDASDSASTDTSAQFPEQDCPPPIYSENDEQPIYSEPDSLEPDYQEPTPNPLTVYGNQTAGEFAGDMYRPEGYNKKIGSVLAIMMSMNKNEETKFNVLVHTYDSIDLKDHLAMFVDEIEIITVEINGNFAGQAFYVQITDAQIQAISDSGIKCYYIGSGLGDIRDINWATEEGIRTYCEIWGDMYTFNNRDVLSSSDIYMEE
ncbi:MAG: hypothetical protein E7586_06350 [Ruminococcaceae bacterium]|nr:hypothetical protein [Oscillospiraceae bacterium]